VEENNLSWEQTKELTPWFSTAAMLGALEMQPVQTKMFYKYRTAH
jgi:hypothetical protein